MRSGGMRHVVKIMQRSSVRSASGAQSTEYVEIAERMAEVKVIGGREFFAAQSRGAEVATTFIMRKYDTLIPAMRLVWDGKTYDVKAVLSDPVKDEMTVMAVQLIPVLTANVP